MFIKQLVMFMDELENQKERAVEELTPPPSTERKHVKCLSILRTRAETLARLVGEEDLEISTDFVVDVKSTKYVKHREWVYTL